MRRKPPHLGLFVVGALALALVAGCDSTATPTVQPLIASKSASATAIKDTHEIRVISLDFDPAIGKDGAVDSLVSRTVLVAVDNRGNQPESNVTVALAVRSPSDKSDLIYQSQVIASLAPGEVKVLKFTGLNALPDRPTYTLAVDASPVPEEENTANNYLTMDVRIQKP